MELQPTKIIYIVRNNKIYRYHAWIGTNPFKGLSDNDYAKTIEELKILNEYNNFGCYNTVEDFEERLNMPRVIAVNDLITEDEQQAISYLNLN